jgi:hypothetical protein
MSRCIALQLFGGSEDNVGLDDASSNDGSVKFG